MADETSSRDVNRVTVITGVTDDTDKEIVQVRVDPTTKRLKVASSATESAGHSAVGSGTLYIKGAGSVQQLHADTDCKRVFVQADAENTGPIMIGGSSVSASLTLKQGLAIYNTQGVWLNVDNLNLLYATSATKGDAIIWYYES